MRKLVPQLLAAAASGNKVALCRLVETRGSTPQKAGAAMLVFQHGSQAGTLGGGCVEAEVKRRALTALGREATEITRFELDHDYGWDDGLICGGRMTALIDPIEAESDLAYFHRLQEQFASERGCTEAVVFDDSSCNLPVGAQLLLDDTGKCIAQRPPQGSPAIALSDAERSLTEHLLDIASRPRPYARQGISFLPHLPHCPLLIVGGGHVGQAVAELAARLDFEVTVVDDRADCVTQQRFPTAMERLSGPIDQILPKVPIGPNTFCLVVTRGHNHDQEALYHLAQRGAGYVGMIGSRRKIRLIFENLEAEGIAREALDAVHAPVGLDIGSQTVPEIAVSICAELIAERNLGKSPRSRSDMTANPTVNNSSAL